MLLAMLIALLSPNLPLDWRAIPFHLLLLQCWWASSTPAFIEYLNVPSWSISCEWFSYVLAPVAIFFVLGNGRRWVLVVVTMGGYACGLGWFLWDSQSDFSRLYFVSWFAPSRFVEFLAGVFLARVFLASSWPKLSEVSISMQAIGVLLIVAGAIYRQFSAWSLWGGLLYVPGSVLLVLGLAYSRGIFVAHLSRSWLNRLGVASFSLYMIHAPLIRGVKGVFLYLGWEVHSWPEFLANARLRPNCNVGGVVQL
jgi:peptidoglycan/LPS O-acetylase OafA/YrhL